MANVRILDPACGSGNFLYVAINLLLDLEKEVIAYGASKGLTQLPQVRPTQLAGIEINPYAQQLAQVVIWIGYIQWMHHNGFNPPRDPVLDPIESIRCTDAILDLNDPTQPEEPEWPETDFIIGNPPFLGGKRLRTELGDSYVDAVFSAYSGRVPREADLVAYWFEKARDAIERHRCRRSGLLATQSIRAGANRQLLERIKESGDIFMAWSDQPWILDGAAVRVSMVGFDDGAETMRVLDGNPVSSIHANLSAATADVTHAKPIRDNQDISYMGDTKGGAFDIADAVAREFISQPCNPNGRPNSDVIVPWANGQDIAGRYRRMWIIDFGVDMPLAEAAGYEGPFRHLEINVKPERALNKRASYRERWWIHVESRPAMRSAFTGMARFALTPRVAKHRYFVWLPSQTLPDSRLYAFANEEDYFFGLLHSRLHQIWSLATSSRHGVGNDPTYNNTTCFETFPFPVVHDGDRSMIATAARELDEFRSAWLNPLEWTREEILEFLGSVDGPWRRYVQHPDARGIGTVRYPRLIPKDAETAKQLAKRTLTNLYNERPTWLDLAHRQLDEAVFAAYGWPSDLTDDQILERLLALNLERAAGTGSTIQKT
ncbi:MAG TPA: DNA methyltransferase [Planctomycetaceae bacterium]